VEKLPGIFCASVAASEWKSMLPLTVDAIGCDVMGLACLAGFIDCFDFAFPHFQKGCVPATRWLAHPGCHPFRGAELQLVDLLSICIY
jgi:hypothetical protein